MSVAHDGQLPSGSTDYRQSMPSVSISTLPDEILSNILRHVMSGSVPVQLSILLESRTTASQRRDQVPSNCRLPICDWLTTVQCRHFCVYELFGAGFPLHQAGNIQDWVLANGVSHRFRTWAKEAFFSEKVFTIEPSLLRRLKEGEIKSFSTEDTQLLFKHASHILAHFPTIDGFRTLPRYHHFKNLRSLVLLPPSLSEEFFYEKEAHRELVQEPIPDELGILLRDIGLEIGGVRVEIIRSEDSDRWGRQLARIKRHVYPNLGQLRAEMANARI